MQTAQHYPDHFAQSQLEKKAKCELDSRTKGTYAIQLQLLHFDFKLRW